DTMTDALGEHPALLRRAPTPCLPAPGPMDYHYCVPGPGEIDLGFAGRKEGGDPVHQAITRLQVGDALQFVEDERGVWLRDAFGVTVGRMAKNFKFPAGLRCQSARVRAILVWRKSDSAPEYQVQCRCETWEVVLPEL